MITVHWSGAKIFAIDRSNLSFLDCVFLEMLNLIILLTSNKNFIGKVEATLAILVSKKWSIDFTIFMLEVCSEKVSIKG